MSILYPRVANSAADTLYRQLLERTPAELTKYAGTYHPGQFFAATGGSRVTQEALRKLRDSVCGIAEVEGFPHQSVGRDVNQFDNNIARAIHASMGLVAAEASVRSIWAFMALVVLPDVAFWRYPDPPRDRVLATDITRHVFGRLWWRAELLYDASEPSDPYHLLHVFPERNFDRILARRRSIGGSPELVKVLAKVWRDLPDLVSEREILEDTLKHLMRRGAFQDLFDLPEPLLRAELVAVIEIARSSRSSPLNLSPVTFEGDH